MKGGKVVLAKMTPEAIEMRLGAICMFLEDHGPASRKQIGKHFGYTASWANPYLQRGIEQGRIIKTQKMRPEKFDVCRSIDDRMERMGRKGEWKELVFLIEVGFKVEPNMEVHIDEALELLRQYGRADVIDATIKEGK